MPAPSSITAPRHPSLYQINTRVWLAQWSQPLGRPATLDDVPDDELDQLAQLGFDWIWLLSVWQIGHQSQQVSRTNPHWRHEFEQTLTDLIDDDIVGSGFAITAYTVHAALGGNAALARLRQRLRERGMRLMLDFVPNHVGLGHPWVDEHPEYFVAGTEHDLARAPQNFARVKSRSGELLLAHGRDPYFDGWCDTLQLDYSHPATQAAMSGELVRISRQCDGVRCDMAMLVLPEVFERTWGKRAPPFWPQAIERVRSETPDFTFMAEVYWDMEWTLQQQGFEYAYDKRLYDRLRDGVARPVREHFLAGLDYQLKLARFLENHDEPRAAATFPFDIHQAAAVITYLSPGLRFFYQGQLDGRLSRISPHLGRAPREVVDEPLRVFYDQLLAILRRPVVREGQWQLLECSPAWPGNGTNDCFVAFAWELSPLERLVTVVNYAPQQSQCHVRLPFGNLGGQAWRLCDQLSGACFDWHGDDLEARGLFIDHQPWQAAVFTLERGSS